MWARRRFFDGQLGRLGVDRHVGEAVGEGLVGRYWHAELLRGGVRDRGVERAPSRCRVFGGGDDGGLVDRGDHPRPVACTPSSQRAPSPTCTRRGGRGSCRRTRCSRGRCGPRRTFRRSRRTARADPSGSSAARWAPLSGGLLPPAPGTGAGIAGRGSTRHHRGTLAPLRRRSRRRGTQPHAILDSEECGQEAGDGVACARDRAPVRRGQRVDRSS